MKKLLVLLSLAGLTHSMHATKFVMMNGLPKEITDKYILYLRVYQGKQDKKCSMIKNLSVGFQETKELVTDTYGFALFKKECCVTSIDVGIQEKNTSIVTILKSLTAEELTAIRQKRLADEDNADSTELPLCAGYFDITVWGLKDVRVF